MRFSHWMIVALLGLILLAGCAPGLPARISPQEAQSRLESGGNVVLLDVRTPEEWSQDGHAPEAILIPLDELPARAAAELDRDATIIVICRSGSRSQVAADYLRQMGFSQVTMVEGGMERWASMRLSIVCDVSPCGLTP